MLRITQSVSAEAAKHYFGESLCRGDYYLEGLEVAGNWGGKGAKLLGLSGAIDQATFEKVLSNHRPDGERLTARMSPKRRPGYDFTFDVPKSVSVLYAVSGDKRIERAMRKAISDTMRDIEAEMFARVRKNGAFEDRCTGNMIWADFTHLTTRPAALSKEVEKTLLKANPWLEEFRDEKGRLNLPDPHLHAHVYVMNATFDATEQMWKAGEFMRIKRDARYYEAAYHVRLANQLQLLGYDIEPTANAFEIAGVSRNIIETYSRRTKEIEETASKLGITDDRLKDGLGAKTRRGKMKELGVNELRRVWRSMLSERYNWNVKVAEHRAVGKEIKLVLDGLEAGKAGIDYALGHELERVSEVSERRLLASAMRHAVGKIRVETAIKALSMNKKIEDAFVDGERHITTIDVMKEEKELMRYVRDGRGTKSPIVWGDYEFKNKLFKEKNESTKEQRDAVLHVLHSSDWIVGIRGRAGTGKTTLLQEVQAGVSDELKNLVVCAPTSEAARGVLRSEGFKDANTIKSLLYDTKAQEKLSNSVLWIDESGMVGNRDLLDLFKLAKDKGVARVVLAGDPAQIHSVPRGDPLRFLEEYAGLSVVTLETVRRQKSPELKRAVEAISNRDAVGGFKILDSAGCIHEAETEDSHKALAKEYASEIIKKVSKGREVSVLAVCPTHNEGKAVSEAIRNELQSQGLIEEEDTLLNRTIGLGWTKSEKENAAMYEPGLVVQFKRRWKLFDKGERLLVESVDSRNGVVMVRDNLNSLSKLPIKDSEKFQVYRHEKMKVAVGDLLKVTETNEVNGHRLNNGSIVKVVGFDRHGYMKLSNGGTIPKSFGHLTHGYVITADTAQSKTVDTVLAAISRDSMSATDMPRFYVAMSRARHKAKIFTDDKEELQLAIQRDMSRRSAHELLGEDRDRVLKLMKHQQIEREMAATRSKNLSTHRENEMEVSFG